ncbi:hypothetical protein PACTADRAFT_42806 [Pachysolen tannophilus NRRL Y-2460]|uniref:ATP-dependent (S)-NAD(P)H-hydrate dehydratase n=1 Tax=Pachysolen tannophilus NRRL Y-2460 TaxID=669874 RepID=A0A1E4TU87_PACTA|nr:hypothetical protein PACTADRAFT_42806 [Pachysolen tannophilus NRRL Y-2460]
MSLVNKSTKELISLTKKFIPPLLSKFHKGQAGRVVVIGGCEDYTGAPFFSAHASALMGCDLTHIICETLAAPIIKSYSPDLMVHPYMFEKDNIPEKYQNDDGDGGDEEGEFFLREKVMKKISQILDRVHVVVAGPGFGRDGYMLRTLELIIGEVKKRNLPLILDADALYLVSLKPEIIKGYEKAVLTPNVVEFKRLADSLGVHADDAASAADTASQISKKLGNVTIVQKGEKDIIVKGDNYVISSTTGSNKRVGGQGDSFTGVTATLLSWTESAYKPQIWEGAKTPPILTDEELIILSCFGGSTITRLSARKAFVEKGRAMQTSDLHKFIGISYHELFEIDNNH